MTSREFQIDFTENSIQQLIELKNDPAKKGTAKAVAKSIKLMSQDLRHPSLYTHKYDDLSGADGEIVFETYAQNKTSGAYRIFWYYGPGRNRLTIIDICPHP